MSENTLLTITSHIYYVPRQPAMTSTRTLSVNASQLMPCDLLNKNDVVVVIIVSVTF